ncbi:helix-turn-helix transcriptional regulator [uncultured Exiguobacterium sp.]|uniref:helix-turn-helix transcriptional regulator n=1 Tax=uncultured Exiguobacterium sp. TaxID=202669 RepID=UPI0025E669E0|nr:helix-turn-helix transcriptional regulator [uncultured Exiguobacterium sp.]
MPFTPREKLRMKRFESGLTQTFIAKKLGFTTSQQYYKIEAGRRDLTVGEALVLCDLFKTTCEELFFEEKYRVLSNSIT